MNRVIFIVLPALLGSIVAWWFQVIPSLVLFVVVWLGVYYLCRTNGESLEEVLTYDYPRLLIKLAGVSYTCGYLAAYIVVHPVEVVAVAGFIHEFIVGYILR